MTIYSWSTTKASNASVDATIDLASNKAGVQTRDGARGMMARLAAWVDTLGGTVTYGGTGNTYTATSPSGHALSAYAAGVVYMFVPNATNTGAATLNVDGLGAVSIRRPNGSNVASGDLVSGGRYLLVHDGTNFQVVGDVPSAGSGVYQPLDATLTAFGALSFSGTDQFLKATGVDTFVVETASTFRTSLGATATGGALFTAADAAAARTTLALGTAATVNTGTSGAVIPLLNAANTFSATQTFSSAVDLTFSGNNGPRFANPYIAFRRVDGTRNGFIQALDASSLTVTNEATGGAINFVTTGGGAVQANGVVLVTRSAVETIDGAKTFSALGTFSAGLDVTGGTLLAPLRAGTEASGTLTRAGSANRVCVFTAGITINNSVFQAGDVISGYNNSASAFTVTAGAGVTMRLVGTATTGNRTVAQRARFEIYFLSASECIVSGAGVT